MNLLCTCGRAKNTCHISFDDLLPPTLLPLSFPHFAPEEVARAAAQYLVTSPATRVLDVGSGAGKFCCIAAQNTPGHFTGVERRPSLHAAAVRISNQLKLPNVHFLLGDMNALDFAPYDAFFLYNPFYENLGLDAPIDDSVLLEKANYERYSTYVREQLATRPSGTRVATYYSFFAEIPRPEYRQLPDTGIPKLLFWERI